MDEQVRGEEVDLHLLLGLIDSAEGRHEDALAMVEREPADWARLTGIAVVKYAAGVNSARRGRCALRPARLA